MSEACFRQMLQLLQGQQEVKVQHSALMLQQWKICMDKGID